MACLLWSSAFFAIKIGLQYTTPIQFAGLRFMLAGLLVLPLCGNLTTYIPHVLQDGKTVILVSLFQTAFLYTLLYSGLNLLPASTSAIIVGSQPLVIAVLAHFFSSSEQMTFKKLISIILGLSGVTIISLTRGEINIQDKSEFLGILLILCSNLSAGIGNLLIAKRQTSVPPMVLNSSQLFLGGLLMFLLSLPLEGTTLKCVPAAYYLSLLWLSFISAASLSIWFRLLKQPGVLVSELNIWKFLIPLSGACLSWIILPNESPELATILGMVCICSALLVLNSKRTERDYRLP